MEKTPPKRICDVLDDVRDLKKKLRLGTEEVSKEDCINIIRDLESILSDMAIAGRVDPLKVVR